MRLKGWVWVLLFAGFLCFSVYAYRVRTNFNISEEQALLYDSDHRVLVLSFALSLFPKTEKNEIYFNSIEAAFPRFKEDPVLCEKLGYKEPKKEEGEEKMEEKEKKAVSKDATSTKVLDNIIDAF